MPRLSRTGTGEPLILEGEEWRDIDGVPHYQVSNFGRVKSLERISHRYNPRWGCASPLPVKAKILNQNPLKYRYKGGDKIRDDRPTAMMVGFIVDGKHTVRYVHHLVLEAFVGPRPPGMEACHFDGNAQNNRLENLRWGTSAENKADAIRLNQFWPTQRRKRCLTTSSSTASA